MLGVPLLATPLPQAFAQSITVAVGADIETLEPHHATTFSDHVIARTLHRGLTQYQPNGTLGPGLAESWTIASDGRTYTFSLKPGLTWSDGRPLTASDFVAGIEHALDPIRPSPFAAKLFAIAMAGDFYYGSLKEGRALGVSAPDPATVVIKLSRRAVDFLETLAHPVAMPVPTQERTALHDGTVTSGTYRVARANEAGEMVLESISTGPGLVVRTVGSVTDAWNLMGDDGALVTAALPAVTSPTLGDRSDWIQVDRTHTLYAYGVNTARNPFNTIEVRHALAMAINRPKVLEGLPQNIGVPANQYVPPSVMGELGSYKAPFAPLTFEEREAVASALLAELGFDRDNPLRVNLRVPIGDIHRTAAESIAAMWAHAGIFTDIIEAPLFDHWRALERGDFDVAFMAWPGRNEIPQSILEPLSLAGGPWNFPRYAFSEFTERLNRALSYDKEMVRLGYYREAEKAIIEDQALIAVFFYRPLSLVSPDIQGWIANSSGQHPLSALTTASDDGGVKLIRPTLPQAVPSFGADP